MDELRGRKDAGGHVRAINDFESESRKEPLRCRCQQVDGRNDPSPRELNRRARQIAANAGTAVFGVDDYRPQKRTAFVHLECRTADDAVRRARDECIFEVLPQAIGRQMLAFEERRDDVVIGWASWNDGDGCHWSFAVAGAQHGRFFARAAAGTQQPVCFSSRSASFRSASTCPSTCVVAPSIVATIGSVDFDRL